MLVKINQESEIERLFFSANILRRRSDKNYFLPNFSTDSIISYGLTEIRFGSEEAEESYMKCVGFKGC